MAAVLCLLVLVLHEIALAVAQNVYKIPGLLQPQLDLQINLRIPDKHYLLLPKFSPALTQAIDFLTFKSAPFRLLYNVSQAIPLAPMFQPSRHAQNQVLCLVFVIVRNETETLSLFQVLKSCSLETAFGASSAIQKSFIQLVVDTSAAAESWHGGWRLNIPRAYVPPISSFCIGPTPISCPRGRRWCGRRVDAMTAALLFAS